MRSVSLLAILASSLSLAACAGGSGGGGLTTGSGTLAAFGEVCGVADTRPECQPGSWVPKPAVTPTPTPTPTPTGGGTGTGGTNAGNSTRLTTGDTSIILESSKLKNTKAKPGLSELTLDAVAATAQIKIDTKMDDTANAKWPKAKAMEEYVPGTVATNPDVSIGSLGGTYTEYRALSYNADNSSADEELQVWNWGESYGTQYRDITAGGEAGHQAWTFGGNKTLVADMPTTGNLTYNGRYGATAKTWSWVDPNNGRTVSGNNLWRITGSANGTADFATGNFEATLTPEVWNAYASLNGGQGFTAVQASDNADVNFNDFMNDNVILKGTFTHTDAVGTTPAANGNTISGNAKLDQANGWVNNQTVNPFYAAFFGPNANQVTGVFNLEAVMPDPIGGDIPINDDRRGFIQQSGIFNLQ